MQGRKNQAQRKRDQAQKGRDQVRKKQEKKQRQPQAQAAEQKRLSEARPPPANTAAGIAQQGNAAAQQHSRIAAQQQSRKAQELQNQSRTTSEQGSIALQQQQSYALAVKQPARVYPELTRSVIRDFIKQSLLTEQQFHDFTSSLSVDVIAEYMAVTSRMEQLLTMLKEGSLPDAPIHEEIGILAPIALRPLRYVEEQGGQASQKGAQVARQGGQALGQPRSSTR
jgi:hypothetical protein